MTPALKDIGRISELLGVSPLSQSAIWSQSVDSIDPIQICAFEKRLTDLGQRDIAETAIDIAQAEVHKAVARNEINVPPMLSYVRSLRTYLTAGELRDGLLRLTRLHATVILFALETNLDSMTVATLTYQRLALMELSPLAKQCLNVCPRHLRTPYVFWEQQQSDGKVAPIFGLDAVVFETFGLVWAELAFGYKHLIMIDGAADRKSLECYLQ